MRVLSFDLRGLAGIPGLAWSLRKMYVAFRGILIAWGIYLLCAYMALFVSPAGKAGPVSVFRFFEFFPYPPAGYTGIAGYALWLAGIVIALSVMLSAAASVSRLALDDLDGNAVPPSSRIDSRGGMFRTPVVPAMASLATLFLVFILGAMLAAEVGRIPGFGELALAAVSLPLFFWGLLGVVVLITFLFGFNIMPAIAARGDEDVLETVIQVFSIVWRRPFRFLFYQIAARVVTLLSGVMLALLSLSALLMILTAAAPIMGFKANQIFTTALYRLPFVMDTRVFPEAVNALSGILGTPGIVDTTVVPLTVRVAGWMLGVSFLLAGAWVGSFVFSAFFSAQSLICLALRGRSDVPDGGEKSLAKRE